MLTKTEKLNALKAISRKALDELKPVDKKDLPAMTKIMDKYEKLVAPMGFNRIHINTEIGYMTGSLTDRRMQ